MFIAKKLTSILWWWKTSCNFLNGQIPRSTTLTTHLPKKTQPPSFSTGASIGEVGSPAFFSSLPFAPRIIIMRSSLGRWFSRHGFPLRGLLSGRISISINFCCSICLLCIWLRLLLESLAVTSSWSTPFPAKTGYRMDQNHRFFFDGGNCHMVPQVAWLRIIEYMNGREAFFPLGS